MRAFAQVPSLEERSLALPHTKALLMALHIKEQSLQKTTPVETAWDVARKQSDEPILGMDSHVDTAREAGFIEERPCSGNIATRIALTDKGRAVIGVKRPFWMEGAA